METVKKNFIYTLDCAWLMVNYVFDAKRKKLLRQQPINTIAGQLGYIGGKIILKCWASLTF